MMMTLDIGHHHRKSTDATISLGEKLDIIRFFVSLDFYLLLV